MKKPKFPKSVKRPFKRSKPTEERVAEAFASVPRITNETVAEHREEVLSSARKYIYPLKHSKNRVVRISVILFVTVVVVFFAYCGLALYKFHSSSTFIYGVTQVIPFPVAKAGPSWVSYESYLFELRRNMHYYQTQQAADFSTKTGKAQLSRLREQALQQVVQDAYTKQLAKTNNVTVSQQDIDNEVTLVRQQNRLGSNDRVFNDVLNQFWGWNEADFEKELKQQLLQQAVVAKLDTKTNQTAAAVLKQLQSGADFAALAGQYSQDLSTKTNGGQYAAAITSMDQNISPQVTQQLFKLKAGQISGIINTGYTLEILKVLDSSQGTVHAAHIQFNFLPITDFTSSLESKHKQHDYINV